jgi:hypothetical protein
MFMKLLREVRQNVDLEPSLEMARIGVRVIRHKALKRKYTPNSEVPILKG